MNCPKCNSPMETATFHNETVNRCTNCKGLWLDDLAFADLKELKGAEAIDTGDPKVGRQYNKIDRIHCPECGGTGNLIRMVDSKQPHIWFECCDVCGGVFFDAGEFKDLKQESIAGYFRDLFSKQRK